MIIEIFYYHFMRGSCHSDRQLNVEIDIAPCPLIIKEDWKSMIDYKRRSVWLSNDKYNWVNVSRRRALHVCTPRQVGRRGPCRLEQARPLGRAPFPKIIMSINNRHKTHQWKSEMIFSQIISKRKSEENLPWNALAETHEEGARE